VDQYYFVEKLNDSNQLQDIPNLNIFQAYLQSKPAFFVCDVAVSPGGMRRWDRFVLRSLAELKYLVQQEFRTNFFLAAVMSYGQDILLRAFQPGGEFEPVECPLRLLTYIRLKFENGSIVWFEDVCQEEITEDIGREFTYEDGGLGMKMSGAKTQYIICCDVDYECPICREHTLECECFQDIDVNEIQKMAVQVDFDSCDVPTLKGRPLAVHERIHYEGKEYSYGQISLEGGEDYGIRWKEVWGNAS
jgi:hypothetical protein